MKDVISRHCHYKNAWIESVYWNINP